MITAVVSVEWEGQVLELRGPFVMDLGSNDVVMDPALTVHGGCVLHVAVGEQMPICVRFEQTELVKVLRVMCGRP